MRLLYYVGGVFLIVAFFSAAAEVLVHSARDKTQMIVAAHDLLYTIWPSGLLILQIRLENISPHLWDPWVLSMLSMPAWALFGLPGFLFITLFRPKRPDFERRLEEARQKEQQLLLYDELAREARSRGIARQEDDMRPNNSGHELFLKDYQQNSDGEEQVSNLFNDDSGAPEECHTNLISEPTSQKPNDETPSGRKDIS